MRFGICKLGVVPLRAEPSDKSEMVSQLLYGEHFEILKEVASWSYITLAYDAYQGWIDTKQYLEVSADIFDTLERHPPILLEKMTDYVYSETGSLIAIPFGASLQAVSVLGHRSTRSDLCQKTKKSLGIIQLAYRFLNAPYLWGGKSQLGLDCSGFTQLLFRQKGYRLCRDASQQVTQGEEISNLENAQTGDLAFFENPKGNITHVGILSNTHQIIHAHGKVRIDAIDKKGIFNAEKNQYTHRLQTIKRL